MTVPPEAVTKHAPGCLWEQADCEWKTTHRYCPHPEHLCNCNYPARERFRQRKNERAAYEYGFKEGAAAERDRWRPMIKQIYDAAIEGGKSPAEVRHRIINILDDAGAFGGGPFADLLDGAP